MGNTDDFSLATSQPRKKKSHDGNWKLEMIGERKLCLRFLKHLNYHEPHNIYRYRKSIGFRKWSTFMVDVDVRRFRTCLLVESKRWIQPQIILILLGWTRQYDIYIDTIDIYRLWPYMFFSQSQTKSRTKISDDTHFSSNIFFHPGYPLVN